MARVKRAVNAHKKRRVILERAEGYRGQRSRLYRKAKEQVTHSLVYAYRDRRAAQGRLPPPVDPAHQRRVPRERPDLQPLHPGPRPRRRRGRPSHPRRARRQRARRPSRPRRPRKEALPADTLGASTPTGVEARPGIASPCIDECRGRPRAVRKPRCAAVAKRASAAAETGLFLLEGPQAVARGPRVPARDRGRAVRDADGAGAAHRHRATAAATPGVEVEFVDRAGPRRDGRHRHAAGRRRGRAAVADVASATLLAGSPRLVAILEEVRDPGNAGTIIRAADAAGADAVILTGRTRRPLQPKVVRVDDRVAVPPAGRRRARASPPSVGRARDGGPRGARRRHQGRGPAVARATAARRADRVAVRQRGARAGGARRWRSPTARRACRSTAAAESMNLATAAASACTSRRSRSAPDPHTCHFRPRTGRMRSESGKSAWRRRGRAHGERSARSLDWVTVSDSTAIAESTVEVGRRRRPRRDRCRRDRAALKAARLAHTGERSPLRPPERRASASSPRPTRPPPAS